jgi:hypothetical protein
MSRTHVLAVFGLTLLLTSPVSAAKVDPLLPDATTTVAFVNVRQMVDLPAAKPHAEAMLAFVLQLAPEQQQALDALGIRPLEDIDTLTVAVETAKRRTLIVHGKFNRDRIGEAVERLVKKAPERIKPLRDGDTVVYEQRVGRDTVYSAIPDEGTLLFSWNVERCSAAAQGKAPAPKLTANVKDLVASMDDTRSVWVVFADPRQLLEGLLKSVFNPLDLPIVIKPPLLRRLEAPVLRVGAVTCAVGIEKEITVAGSLRTEEREARLLAEILGDTRPLQLLVAGNAQLGRERGGALADVIADTQVKADKGEVTFKVKVTSEKLRVLLR